MNHSQGESKQEEKFVGDDPEKIARRKEFHEQQAGAQETNQRKRKGPRPKRVKQKKRPHTAVIENKATVRSISVHIDPLFSSSWLRRIEPYPYTFVSFAKARWIGRTILEIYTSEFQSYPESYYRQAIEQGRIKVSNDEAVDCNYRIKGTDVLRHTVHRHEPSVRVTSPSSPHVNIVGDTPDILAVDKPATIPVHPCGGYHQNSLVPLLERAFNQVSETHQDDDEKMGSSLSELSLFTIHRLDRLTSGLVILAKKSEIARDWAKSIQQRDSCTKIYLARVRGRFPVCCPTMIPRLVEPDRIPVYGEWQGKDSCLARLRNAIGYWISGTQEPVRLENLTLDQFAAEEHSVEAWLDELSNGTPKQDTGLKWIHLACPVRIANHKDGVCESGIFDKLDETVYQTTVKSAETAFAVISYDKTTDSTVVLCRPGTGRTHQIRLHLQAMGHPIANDPNYGGEIWYANPRGQTMCAQARRKLDSLDASSHPDDSTKPDSAPTKSLVTSSVPATHDEIARMDQLAQQHGSETESLNEFIGRTCVWCARSAGQSAEERSRMEFLVRSPGIWLHALQYNVVLENGEKHSFRTRVPSWSTLKE